MNRYLRAILCLVAAFTALCLPAAALAKAADYTFSIVVEAHCVSKATVCGANSEADFESGARQAIFDLNEYWRSTGISFQLGKVEFNYADDYAEIRDDSLDAGEEADLALLNTLRLKAKNDPSNVYWFVIEKIGFCFSGIPGAHLGRTPNVRMPNEYYGLFCSGVDGNTMAHELGHHFCLNHPFTEAEPTSAAAGVNHDGDGLTDTPDDPSIAEGAWNDASQAARDNADVVYTRPTQCWRDPETCGAINDRRDWCGYTYLNTDPGSYRPGYCDPSCRRKMDGVITSTAYSPAMELIMSYYKWECSGPFVYNFQTYDAFSPQQIDMVRSCVIDGDERGQLVDRCGGVDSDWDGLCDPDDPCPGDPAATSSADKDGDGVPDKCDPCPDIVNSGLDTDGDGVDDACDDNDDNDACVDSEDLRPKNNTMQIGTILTPGCSKTTHAVTASESADTDGDGIRDCAEADNDNDGIDDGMDPCPNLADSEMCDIPGDGCALEIPWATCLGGGCAMDIWARLESIMHPDDPRLEIPVRFQNESMFLMPSTGRTAGEIRGGLTGINLGLAEGNETVGMSLVDSTGAKVADVGTYRLGDVTTIGGNLGNAVEVRFDGYRSLAAAPRESRAAAGTMKLKVGLTWGVGIPADEVLADADGDGVPDVADNCVETANTAQVDSDGDRVGNACDPDSDDDGLVTQADLDRIAACVGADVASVPRMTEPGQQVMDPGMAEQSFMALRCRFADLDGNGIVGEADSAAAAEYLGRTPGPSGMVDTSWAVVEEEDDGGCTAGMAGTAGSAAPYVLICCVFGGLLMAIGARRRFRAAQRA